MRFQYQVGRVLLWNRGAHSCAVAVSYRRRLAFAASICCRSRYNYSPVCDSCAQHTVNTPRRAVSVARSESNMRYAALGRLGPNHAAVCVLCMVSRSVGRSAVVRWCCSCPWVIHHASMPALPRHACCTVVFRSCRPVLVT